MTRYIYREESEGGFLYDKETLTYSSEKEPPEDAEFRPIHRQPKRPIRSPLRVYFETTKRCNLRCIHCFNGSRDKMDDELDTYGSRKLLDELREEDLFEIRFTGGEFTARSDWQVLLRHSLDLGLISSINTNGVLKKKDLETLVKISPHQLIVSLDGPEEIHDHIRGKGTFRQTYETLVYLSKGYKGQLRINSQLNSLTKGHAVETVSIAESLGIDICFIQTWDLGRSKDLASIDMGDTYQELDKLEPGIKVHYRKKNSRDLNNCRDYTPICLAAERGFTVKADGEVYACAYLAELENYKGEFSAGNIRNSSVNEIWETSMQSFRKMIEGKECFAETLYRRRKDA